MCDNQRKIMFHVDKYHLAYQINDTIVDSVYSFYYTEGHFNRTGIAEILSSICTYIIRHDNSEGHIDW